MQAKLSTAYPPPIFICLLALLVGAGATLNAWLAALPANQFSIYATQTLLAFPLSAFTAAGLIQRIAVRRATTPAWRFGMYALTYIAIAALASILLKIYLSIQTLGGDLAALAAEILNPLTLTAGAWTYYVFMVKASNVTFVLFAGLLAVPCFLPERFHALQTRYPTLLRDQAWLLPALLAIAYVAAVVIAAIVAAHKQ